jgi:hypothetical protein
MNRSAVLLLAAFLVWALIVPATSTTVLACSADCEKGSCTSGSCTGIAVCKCTRDGRPKCKCYGKNSMTLTFDFDEF